MQHIFPGDFSRFRLQKLGALLRHLAAENPANINQGMAAANHAGIMRAVAHNVAFRAQYRVLQCNRIQSSARRKQATSIRLVHHSPLGRGPSCRIFCWRLPGVRMAHLGHPRFGSKREFLLQSTVPKCTPWGMFAFLQPRIADVRTGKGRG